MPTIHQALRTVANHDGDRARSRNDVGFSGRDTEFANKLAECERLTAKQEWYAARFVFKYREQVVANYEGAGREITQTLTGKARKAAVERFITGLTWEYQSDAEVAKAIAPKRTIKAVVGQNSGEVKQFVVRFPYSPEVVEAVKSIPYQGRRFDGSNPQDKKWTVDPEFASYLRSLIDNYGFVASDGALPHLTTARAA